MEVWNFPPHEAQLYGSVDMHYLLSLMYFLKIPARIALIAISYARGLNKNIYNSKF